MFARLLFVLLVLLSACSDSLLGVGERCNTNAQCADNVCFFGGGTQGVCASACDRDADCSDGLTCGTMGDGRRACLKACTAEGTTMNGYGCVQGAQVACALAGTGVACSQCGCQAGQYCPRTDAVDTCQPPRADGQSCFRNEQCQSSNCSVHDTFAAQPGLCLSAHGAACAPGDGRCLSCDVTIAGNVCSRGCDGADGCAADQECIGRESSGYYCRPRCGRACPAYWRCAVTSDGRASYCAPPPRCNPSDPLPCGIFGTCHPDLRVCYG